MKYYKPNFLDSADHPWVERVLELYRSCVGLGTTELDDRLIAVNIFNIKRQKLIKLRLFLDHEYTKIIPSKTSATLRMELFSKVFEQSSLPSRDFKIQIREEFRERFNLPSSEDVESLLVSDLLGRRRITALDDDLNAAEAIHQANLWLVKKLVRTSTCIRLDLRGQVGRVVRLAKLKGLVCLASATVDPLTHVKGCHLEISGPAVVLFKTNMYGHSLASILGVLPWCDDFTLEAECQRNGESYTLKVTSHDPIKPSIKPKIFDSKLEKQFSRDFVRNFKDWKLTREPGPIETPKGIIFPDFYVSPTDELKGGFYFEIVGWWTKEYLERKITLWKLVQGTNFILCIDKNLGGLGGLEASMKEIFFFSKKIDVLALMALAENRFKTCPPCTLWD